MNRQKKLQTYTQSVLRKSRQKWTPCRRLHLLALIVLNKRTTANKPFGSLTSQILPKKIPKQPGKKLQNLIRHTILCNSSENQFTSV